ncbi:Succinylglutamate desuccinylase/aspartoacylase [Beggiatoa sp. PS]|nr:Succinylglutamate desuccinylase/aspartoacylase [Beggiatoa sp. PS]
MGIISDPFGKAEIEVLSSHAGIVIGRNNLPLVNEGEALFHIARFQDSREVAEQVEAFQVEQQHYMTINGDPPII